MILLIADTPVAGTVNRMAHWIGKVTGQVCHAIIKRNYPNNIFDLDNGAFGCLPDWRHYLSSTIKLADLIIIHNICEPPMISFIKQQAKAHTKIVYQYHSPPGEPPQFGYESIFNNDFDLVMAVAQGYGRFIPDAICIPNIIPDFNPIVPIKKSTSVFIPHLRSKSNRWSEKFTNFDLQHIQKNSDVLGNYQVRTIKQIFNRDAVTPTEILLYLQSATFCIDDIHTGLFHQTLMEAIKAGCIVFSATDMVSMTEFCEAANAPPIPIISVNSIFEVIDYFKSPPSQAALNKLSLSNKNYGITYLGEERLAQIYCATLFSNLKLKY